MVKTVEACLYREYSKSCRLEPNPRKVGREEEATSPYKEVRFAFISVLYDL
jgi:hypothetical protein